jgi:hypothetical protein
LQTGPATGIGAAEIASDRRWRPSPPIPRNAIAVAPARAAFAACAKSAAAQRARNPADHKTTSGGTSAKFARSISEGSWHSFMTKDQLKQAANFEPYNPPRSTTGVAPSRPVPASPASTGPAGCQSQPI